MMKFTDLNFQPHPTIRFREAIQATAFFPNGYGVSVVRFPGSYGYTQGLYEVAVLKGDEKDWVLCYDTPVTDDVMGHRDPTDIENIIEEVMAL